MFEKNMRLCLWSFLLGDKPEGLSNEEELAW